MKEVFRKTHGKIWSFHREYDEAVSPVIATILMVAVTVVLAAAVYFLVSYYNIAPSPLAGSLEEIQSSTNSTELMLTLVSPTIFDSPSDVSMTIINASSTGVGWTIYNVSITSNSGLNTSLFYMNTFTSSGAIWTSSGAVPAHGATSINSPAYIYIQFHSKGNPVKLTGLVVVISYSGTTGSIRATLS